MYCRHLIKPLSGRLFVRLSPLPHMQWQDTALLQGCLICFLHVKTLWFGCGFLVAPINGPQLLVSSNRREVRRYVMSLTRIHKQTS